VLLGFAVTGAPGLSVGAVLLRHGLALPLIVSAICVLAAATYAAAPASSPAAANH
jgi:hypothetical protein